MMSKITLVSGGMRSGKSTYAEKALIEEPSILYIATSMITDEEMEERVRKHKERRGARYKTHEGHNDLDQVVAQATEGAILLECMGTFITNRMFDILGNKAIEAFSREEIQDIENGIVEEVTSILEEMSKSNKNNMIITNEVGLTLISEYKLSRVFTDILGRVNQLIASKADEVYFVVSGIPLQIK